jgi:serine/threonine protein kinase/Flp pilus assembly protein TadD
MLGSVSSAAVKQGSHQSLADLIEELSLRVEAGDNIDLSKFLEDHAQHAEELRGLLPALRLLVDFSRSSTAHVPVPTAEGIESPPSSDLGDFRLIRELGRGGMGIVYEAEQVSLGRRVAVKVLPFAGTMDGKQLQRFRNEAQAAASLHHTNIVPVYFVGCERGVHYYAMQLIEGCTLAGLIRDLRRQFGLEKEESQPQPEMKSLEILLDPNPPDCAVPTDLPPTAKHLPFPLAPALRGDGGEGTATTQPIAALTTEHSTKNPAFFRTAVNLGIQAAEALEHAHQMGIVHRDIKPANLLLDPRGNLWITDFGLAQFQAGTELTMTGDLIGTLRYMSPEQVLAKRVVIDHRTDIYSLGVTLYELLTLQPAFKSENRQELLRQIAFDDPPPLRRLNKQLPEELETIVLKAMEKSAPARYTTAQEMADDLRRYLLHEPIRAKKPTLIQRAGKWNRRHPAVARSAVLVLLLVTVASIVSACLVWQEKKRTALALVAESAERDRAEEKTRLAEEREAETRAVLDFVEKRIFAAARPKGYEGGLGRTVALRQAVEAAFPFVENGFRNQPLIEARLRMTLGSAFLDLGDPQTAATQCERAVSIFTEQQGRQHRDTLSSMTGLAICYQTLGRYPEALALHEDALALKRTTLGYDHPDTLRSMHSLAITYSSLGRYGDALKLREETLALRQATLGDDPDTLRSMSSLARSYYDVGQYADALKLSEKTVSLMRAKLGADHHDTLEGMSNLAISYSALARHGDALPLREELLRRRKEVLGPDHPDTLGAMNNLAITYEFVGRLTAALKLRQDVLTLIKAKLGPDHPEYIKDMNNLATTYQALGRPGDAIKVLEEALSLARSKLGTGHPDNLAIMHNLANNYHNVGRVTEAIKLHEETLTHNKARLGAEHPNTATSMNDLAISYFVAGRYADAIKLGEEALSIRRAKLGPDNQWTLRSLSNLAGMYQDAGRHAEALERYEKLLPLQEAKLGANHPDTISTMTDLAWCLATASNGQLRRPERAVQLARTVASLAPNDGRSWRTLGAAEYRAGMFNDAVVALRKSTDLHKGGGDASDWFFLAMAHWRLGDKVEARKLFDKAVDWMDKNNPKDEELKRFRAEAEGLMAPPGKSETRTFTQKRIG